MSACCLDGDVASFKHGHDQMVGDSGITLSGGQRQRVALARAVYADCDVVVLDDILSAVDSTTGVCF
jgi:ATP-binding cassette, subfamily C (CFTR/MRP), member 1